MSEKHKCTALDLEAEVATINDTTMYMYTFVYICCTYPLN